MTLQETYKKLENDYFNLLIVDPNPLHDLIHFSLILRLENTAAAAAAAAARAASVEAKMPTIYVWQ
jgi:hypothetical protein